VKALLWKEVRENLRWGAAALLAIWTCEAVWIWDAGPSKRLESILSEEFLLLVFFSSAALALALGLLQSLPELRQSAWAFLMHRAVSPGRIFAAKAAAGLGLYFAATLIPFLSVAAWLSMDGLRARPFHWIMVWPGLEGILAGAGFYFAGILVAARQARWYASRLLPLVLPGLALLGTILFVFEVSEFPSPALIGANLLLQGLLALAAWGSFTRSGEVSGQGRPALAALGLTLSISIIVLLALLAAGFASLEHEFGPRIPEHTFFRLDRRGHLLKIRYGRSPATGAYGFLEAQDLDESQDPAGGGVPAQGNPEAEGLPMHRLALDPAAAWPGRLRRERILARGFFSSRDAGGWGEEWIFSAPEGLLLLYENVFEYPRRWYSRLKLAIGPEGFFAPEALPHRRFGRLIAGDWETRSAFDAEKRQLPRWDSRSRHQDRDFLVFEEGIFEVDFPAKEVRRIYAAGEGRRIRSASLLFRDDAADPGEVAIAFDRVVEVFSGRETVAGVEEDRAAGRKVDLKTLVPDQLLRRVAIPGEVHAFEIFQLGWIPDRKVSVFFLANDPWSSMRMQGLARILEVESAGGDQSQVISRRDVHHYGKLYPPTASLLAAALAPIGLALPIAAADEIRQWYYGAGAGWTGRRLAHDTARALLHLALLLAAALACGWAAFTRARRYGLPASSRRFWTLVAALLGPSGLLVFLFLRHWPARTPCPSCRRLRAVNEERCWSCGAPFEARERDGTEIFSMAARHNVHVAPIEPAAP
jgi:hypothetical protein